jgi:hypothetical protein
MTAERIWELESVLGFEWEPSSFYWNEQFEVLLRTWHPVGQE